MVRALRTLAALLAVAAAAGCTVSETNPPALVGPSELGLSLTLIEAARRAGRPRLARHILAERQTMKPTAWSDRIARRIAGEVAGRTEPAAA